MHTAAPIYNEGSGAAVATQLITDSVFVGNIASHRGGAVANRIGNQLIDNMLI